MSMINSITQKANVYNTPEIPKTSSELSASADFKPSYKTNLNSMSNANPAYHPSFSGIHRSMINKLYNDASKETRKELLAVRKALGYLHFERDEKGIVAVIQTFRKIDDLTKIPFEVRLRFQNIFSLDEVVEKKDFNTTFARYSLSKVLKNHFNAQNGITRLSMQSHDAFGAPNLVEFTIKPDRDFKKLNRRYEAKH